jgi:ABC-type transport system involved in multi-copper enzyme maturation permease subunit
MSPACVAAVVRFEFRRTATLPRLAWWAVLALFPVVITSLLVGVQATLASRDTWAVGLYTLIPVIVCMLGLLLWATPSVNAEVEGNSWPYLAVRPGGKTNVLIGKYLTAVAWTVLAGWVGLTVSILIAQPPQAVQLWLVLAVLVLFSSVSYGALFTFLGVVAHKRPMVVAVAYALILEFIVGWIPAMINQFTVQLRLRTLLAIWTDWEKDAPPAVIAVLTDPGPAIQQIAILLVASACLLAAAVWILRQKTLVTAGDA